MPNNIENYKKANNTNNFIIVIFILLIIGTLITLYFFIVYKNDNNNQPSVSTTISSNNLSITSDSLTYGNILADGQNTGYYNRFNGFTKNYLNKLNGIKLNNSTVCKENNGYYENDTCYCIAPFYGDKCQNQDYNLDFYEIHAKIYYDDGIVFVKNNPTSFNNDYDIYNIYPGWKNSKTPSMLDYPYNGRYTWYTKEPNGNIIPPFQNILTPTAYSIQDITSKGIYIVKDDIVEKCYILKGIYVIELLQVNDPDYEKFVILMKKDFQFDFAIKDKIIGIPEPSYTGMLYTPKPYFQYDNDNYNIDLDCEFLDTAINPILAVNDSLKINKNICFFPNPMLILNGKVENLKKHNGLECPISTSQYPFGALDAFQCNLPKNNDTINKYPYHDYTSSASQLYTKLKKTYENNCQNGTCTDINNCDSNIKCNENGNDTSDNNDGDFNLGGCLRSIREKAMNLSKNVNCQLGDIACFYQNGICRQKIPATNLSVPTNTTETKSYNNNLIFDFKYYSRGNKENTCENSRRCQYSKQDQSDQGDNYGIVYTNYLTPSSIKSLNPSPIYNVYDEDNTTFGKEFWSNNTSFTNKWYSMVVGDNSVSKWSGWTQEKKPADINIQFQPCCKDLGNSCFYDFEYLENFRKFGNYKFTPRDQSSKYADLYFKNQNCYYDYNPFNLAYDNIHLNNFRPRGLDTYNISFIDKNLFYVNYYNYIDTPTATIKMQSSVKIKLPEYTYIVNTPSKFNMDWNLYDETYKWPRIFNEAMNTNSGLDLYGLLYMVNQLVLPNENPYYQSLGPLIPCSCRCASEVLSNSTIPFS